MTTITTAKRLQDAALIRFAIQGFDATSMNEIAADVGIKKPSVYSHFQNKNELFLSLIPLVIKAELDYASSVLNDEGDVVQQMFFYLENIQVRYSSSYRVQFWIRTLFAPPVQLYEAVLSPMHVFMDEMESIIKCAVDKSSLVPNLNDLNSNTLAISYLSMIETLQSEILFGGPRKFERRLEAVWAIFRAATRSTK